MDVDLFSLHILYKNAEQKICHARLSTTRHAYLEKKRRDKFVSIIIIIIMLVVLIKAMQKNEQKRRTRERERKGRREIENVVLIRWRAKKKRD